MVFYLVGYMGCGKSSIGREAARRAGYGFIDTDREVEKMEGMSVAEIFSAKGEETFRALEDEVLRRVAAQGGNVIVATGGGTPCYSDNMALMNSTGKTIYLRLSPVNIVRRLRPGQAHRPKLSGMSKEQMLRYMECNLPARETTYARAAMTIWCDTLSDDSIVRHVVDYVRYCEKI